MNYKNRHIAIVLIMTSLLISNAPLLFYPLVGNSLWNNNSHPIDKQLNEGTPNTQSLTSDNIYEGIGGAWNITHWANRTDNNLSISFPEGGHDLVSIPLGSGWEGYQLSADVHSLTDTRNWNNGTFNFGSDDGSYGAGENDTPDIVNPYQNWTFTRYNVGSFNNPMSGNYFADLDGHSALELRMDGVLSGSYRYYDLGDRCVWNSTFTIPRGEITNSILQFEANPYYLANFNSWELVFRINGQKIYGIGTYNLKLFGASSWHSFSIPQRVWTNSTNVYSSPANDTDINISIALEYNSATAGYSTGFDNIAYQQLFITNVELITTASVKPSQIQLSMNNTNVEDVDWGKGYVDVSGDWTTSRVYANFSSDDIGLLGNYDVEFLTDLNLFTKKNQPDTNYETNAASIGTKFHVENSSNVNWESYGFIAVPTGYVESQMRIEFPSDVIISSVFSPVEPSINVLDLCDDSTPGILDIPISLITNTPDGFWRFEAYSPNYCLDILSYGNASGIWQMETEFLSGDYINITAKIDNTAIISEYIQATKAQLQIRFPNGSIWTEKTQFASIDTLGHVQFIPFQIPSIPPNYEVGVYQIIVSWNNSHSIYKMNETGLIFKTINVIHQSKLTPEQSVFNNVLEGTLLNLKVSFNDIENFDAIENAIVYSYNFTHPTIIQYFSEISPGFYLLEFNTTGALAGENIVTVYANSSNYVNSEVNITIDVIKQTILTIETTFLQDVSYQSNFTIRFNYTERYGGEGIHADYLATDWLGEHTFTEIVKGNYELTANASDPGLVYDPGKLYNLRIDISANKYVPQSIPVRVYISELESQIRLYINGTRIFNDDLVSYEVWQQLNITVMYYDNSLNHIQAATVKANIGPLSEELDENISLEHYYKTINASDVGQGVHYLSIFVNKTFYNPQSIRAVLQITERQSIMQIFINGENKTIDPTTTVVIGSMINITAVYRDSSQNHIFGADVNLLGDYTGSLIENPGLEYYSLLINSSELGLKTSIITILADKEDLQIQTRDLRIYVRPTNTSIRLVSGETNILIRPGQSVTLEVVLDDLDFGGVILGAEVYYAWEFGSGILRDEDGDGIYTAILDNVPIGAHLITITAFAGENYEFESLIITLSAIIPIEEIMMFLGILFVALGITIAVGVYLYLYRKIFRFPKKVRTVRKYAKTLNKEKTPRTQIDSREKAIGDAYRDELDKSEKMLKSQPNAPPTKPDKLIKKMSLDVAEETPKTND